MNITQFTNSFDACVGHAKQLSYETWDKISRDFMRKNGGEASAKDLIANAVSLGYSEEDAKSYILGMQRRGLGRPA